MNHSLNEGLNDADDKVPRPEFQLQDANLSDTDHPETDFENGSVFMDIPGTAQSFIAACK